MTVCSGGEWFLSEVGTYRELLLNTADSLSSKEHFRVFAAQLVWCALNTCHQFHFWTPKKLQCTLHGIRQSYLLTSEHSFTSAV